MPREICQSAKLVDSDVRLPCVTCLRRSRCLVHFAQRRLFEASHAGAAKKHLISKCSRWEDKDSYAVADVRRNLGGHRVRNLCRECPDSGTGRCETDQNLRELKEIAKAHLFDIETFVFTCHSSDPPDRLYQIGEPKG